MGLFDWVRRLLGAPQPAPPPAPPPASPTLGWNGVIRNVNPPPPPTPATLPPRPAVVPPTRNQTVVMTLDLGAAQFTPLAQDAVRQQAAGVSFGFGLFGRRDLIPPPEDPRTLLIDRAMVGQGLITPEELAEIHRIGREMETHKPDQASAHRVTERKAGDILFLGRGVSHGLSDRRCDVEKLTAAGLPVLASPADLAAVLKLTIPRLRWLAFHAEASGVSHYVHFTVPKKSGGTRILSAPRVSMAAAQQWVLENILAKVPPHAAAHGFVPGRSTLTNAAPHVGAAVVINADLCGFFPTITFPRVRGIFRQFGYSPAVATVLALLCTESPRRKVLYRDRPYWVATAPRGLPQGACTSPALSNLATRRLDARLNGIAAKLGGTYTRYADDLSISYKTPIKDKIGYVLARVRHVAADEGFTVNEEKTRVLKPSARQSVTGIVVNAKPAVPRKTRRKLRAIVHNAARTGVESQNRAQHPRFREWVMGMIAYVSMVNAGHGAALKRKLGGE
jgi:RNA-directed DNA polymerase